MPQSYSAARFEASTRASATVVHPPIVRLTHWLNAVAMIVMIMSGWQIHNAYPTLPFGFPDVLTIGSGLAGALQWHFAAMWLLAANGAVYLSYGVLTGRFRRKLLPIHPSAVLRDIRLALAGKLGHQDLSTYNAVQRLLYAGVIGASILIVVSGIAIWKPVQLRPLTTLLGDFDNARLVHFAAMTAIVLFLVVHVVMAMLVPSSLRAMLRGR
ncbi:MAG TPA: cytochrome b/b6 domain-containing protein [Xanthobacteraceae bacterium]|jgi:thiosulfate reductase cytochrome b subunit|nr:cytochrome b/b6 domain-containing protein [Xanthobacteraceae bacterium]